MAADTSKIKLPSKAVTEILGKLKDTSTIATLSPSQPQKFVDTTHLVFVPTAEAEVVAEGAKKGSYDFAATPVEGKRVKIVTITRVSDELRWADEDNQLEIISAIKDDQAAAIGRALDYVVYHGINPKSGEVMSEFTPLVSGAHKVAASSDAVTDIDSLAGALLDWNITGLALSRVLANDLRKVRVKSTGLRLFPEIPLSLDAGNVDGIPSATSGTVDGRLAKVPTGVRGIMGDFSMIKWGMVRDVWSEVIEYGDPDNIGLDLKGSNQVAFRTEAMLSYAVLDPKAFAVLTASGDGK